MKLRKIIAGMLLLVFAISFGPMTMAADIVQQPNEEKVVKYESLPDVKNVSGNIVKFTNTKIIVPKNDVFYVNFMNDFTTKNLKTGDQIIFYLKQDLKTKEGTLLLPTNTQFIAEVAEYVPPKWFNRNAKVNLAFKEILVPGYPECSMGACAYGKKNVLTHSGWMTILKPALWTVGLFGVGAGLGAAFGACASAAATGCLCIGMPVGGGVGLLVGVVTPGLHYKAKAGKQIPIQLNEDMIFFNNPKNEGDTNN